jgi:hypothetical protein
MGPHGMIVEATPDANFNYTNCKLPNFLYATANLFAEIEA